MTATATNQSDNTSEFSEAVVVKARSQDGR
jgi:hypothetical protein